MSVGGATGLPEKMGKYRVVDRIGRGGMGMIFKAHDPILDRQVALKVISPEVEVTDELRARFFREAQACAKLNHPNIVTVFDMGEDNGRLFIVMELLEGEELRRLIAQRTALTLEEKLSVMLQVCGGLHYAHQKGIVHRDMKPGNIFRLKNGQVKILDFGIAHIASTEGGLTRTGLIMGTLRYMSPEQVRGRADHRSDMFSIGSVFYELLTSRPPFLGEDAMQLLEQLRTEEPPTPTEIDPAIPAEVTAIVQRAMRKNPDERFHDLEEMRSELEIVHGALIEERQRVVARVRRQREQIVQLRAALAERIGSPAEDDTIRPITDRSALVTAQSTERELAALIEALAAKIAEADALAPAVQHAQELLVAGRFEDAVERFEAILADLPEHRLAGEGLARARAEVEANRQRDLATDILQRAQAALDDRRYALCLEIVNQATATPLPPDTTEAIDSLRRAAEARLAKQETLRLARQAAEAAQAEMAKARADGQAEEAPQHAPGVWKEAETAAAAAQADLGREAYVEAKRGFEKATLVYRRSLDVARQAQLEERRTAERERDMARQGQNQARAAGATQYAKDLWAAAEGRFAEAQAIFARKPSASAGSAFTEASALYHRAEAAAREAREREHRRADAARERAMEGQRSAATVDAEHRASAVWQEAVRKSTEGEAALLRQQYGVGAEAFEAALTLYHQAQAQVRELARRQREDARKKQEEMADRRRGAVAAEAASQAASDWKEAEASAATGHRALGREAWEDAGRAFDEAATLYQRAEEHSRDALQARVEAEKAVEATGLARRAAAEAGAATYAPQALQEAESAEARAVATLGLHQFAAARPLFDEASRLYAAAASAAGVAAEAEARRLESIVIEATRLLESGNTKACQERLAEALRIRPRYAAAEALRARALQMQRQAEESARQAEESARQTAAAKAEQRQRAAARPVQPSGTGKTAARAEFDDSTTVLLRTSDLVKPPTISDDREDATVLAARPLDSQVEKDIDPRLPRLKARARDAMGVGSWRVKVGGLLVVAVGGAILVVFAIWRAPLSPPDTVRTISAPIEPPPAPAKAPTPRESPGKSASEPKVDLPPRPQPDKPAVVRTEPDKGAAERAAAEMAAAKAAADKAAADRAAAKAAADKAAADRAAARVAADKAAADRVARVAAEKAAADKAAADKAAADRAAAEKAAAEKAAAERAAARAAADKAAADRAAAEKVAAEKAAAERAAARAAADRAAAEKAAAEKAAADRTAAEKVAAEKVAAVRRDAEQTVMRELKAQADAARKGMLNEKQLAESRGGQDSTEFKAAVGAEKQALSLYEQLAYKEASEKFRAAETQFKQTPAKRRSFGPTF